MPKKPAETPGEPLPPLEVDPASERTTPAGLSIAQDSATPDEGDL